MTWRNKLLFWLATVQSRIVHAQRRLKQHASATGPHIIVPYRSYGASGVVHVRGRVLQDKGLLPSAVEQSLWDHLAAMYRRIETDEVPNAPIYVRVSDNAVLTETDDKGYFSVDLPGPVAPQTTIWIPFQCALLKPPAGQQRIEFEGAALIPGASCQIGVISDIDDTIVVSHAASFLQMARLVLLNNARQRVPFAGAPAFYRALEQGIDADRANPIFYLSSSPYNLYDLLVDFMQIHGFPAGPLLLRDYGFGPLLLRSFDHTQHKSKHIDELLGLYANFPFILIGDSGQQDAEIYAQCVKRWPGRIAAIYIRDVSGDKRDAQVRALIEHVADHGVEMLLMTDTAQAVAHARRRGWITQPV